MREILFRGKRIDNGEWIEGFYAQSGERTYIIFDNSFAVGYVTMKEVTPKTVGQYTGLTDKNGKKIFEGDIVGDGERKYAVSFEKGCWVILGKIEFWDFLQTNAKSYEVIGNIHDNPELMEVLTDE